MSRALDMAVFDTVNPSRFITFTIPDPSFYNHHHHHHHLLRVAVLDSPVQLTESPRVALMFVPKNREHDWVFSTEFGHLQLLSNCPQISRLILMGDQPSENPKLPIIYHRPSESDIEDQKIQEESVKPLVIALSRNFCFKNGICDIPILSYEDNIICSMVLEKRFGDFVGEMLVEDVEIEVEIGSEEEDDDDEDDHHECHKHTREFRRRLRFKRMPNLIQTEIKIVPEMDDGVHLDDDDDSITIGGENVKFMPDIGVLVHVYLVPMVASCSLIGSCIEERIRDGLKPKVLCVGVGGGALVSFLATRLDFEVVGVEMDEKVLAVGRQYFGLHDDGELIRLCVGDAIQFIEKLARGENLDLDTKFDVIMVDLDSGDVKNDISAPPLEFVKKSVLLAARLILSDSGIFVINVIPPNRLFYDTMIHEFREVFHELYEIDVGNEENFVLIATVSPIVSSVDESENAFLKKLRSAISGAFMDSIRKI